jgi:hypothetical protein
MIGVHGDRARARHLAIASAIGAAVGLLGMPVFGVAPETGLDYSWAAGLHLARAQGLDFGRDVLFTFGPLGWIVGGGLFQPGTGVVAIAARFPLMILAGTVVVLLWRRLLPWWAAAAAAVPSLWVIVSTQATGGEIPIVAVMLIGATVLYRLLHTATDEPRWWSAAGGSISALTMLVKFDAGLACLAVLLAGSVVLGVVRSTGVRAVVTRVGLALGAWFASLVVLWALTGQSPGALPTWLRGSAELFTGYNSAMVADYRRANDRPLALLMAVGLGGLLALAWGARRRAGAPVRPVAGAGVMTAGLLVLAAKQSFIRYDAGHVMRMGAVVAMVALVLASRQRASVILCALIIATSVWYSYRADPSARRSLAWPQEAWRQFDRMIGAVVSAGERRRIVATQRAAILRSAEVPDAIVAQTVGRSLHVEPWETSVAWALSSQGTRWSPLPVFQSYSAYTADLDRRNAARLADDRRAPDLVLVEARSIDRRWHRWESPGAWIELLCRYRPAARSERWQLMERRPDGSGCGTPAALGDPVTEKLGGPLITPPAPDDAFVTVRFAGLEPGPVRAVRELLTRSSSWWVLRPFEQGVRLVPGTAGERHLLAVPACLRGRLGPIGTASVPLMSVSPVDREPAPSSRTVTATYEVIGYRCP